MVTFARVYDWQKLAPTRCYLCGLDIPPGEMSREHFIGRQLFENGKIPNGLPNVQPLPSHTKCNTSTQRDEDRMAILWSIVRPDGVKNDAMQERWDRSVRALKRPQAAGLKSSIIDHVEHLPLGVRIPIPGKAAHYAIAKMVRGIIYRETGHVYGDHVRWFVRQLTLDQMVEAGGELRELGPVVAKYLVVPEDPDTSMCFLAIHGIHIVVAFTFPESKPLVTHDGDVVSDADVLPWPRKPDAEFSDG